jgi:hypothetical protein
MMRTASNHLRPHRFAPAASSSRVSRAFSSDKSSLWHRYVDLLEKHPIPTKVGTSAFLVGGGDIACQKLVEGQASVDIKRLGIMTFLGGALVAPVLHVW